MLDYISGIFCLLIIGVGESTELEINDFIIEGNMVGVGMNNKDNLRWPKIIEIFDICSLSCNGKACSCCHHILNIMPVCGSIFIDPTLNTVEMGLTVTGHKAFSTVFQLNGVENFCFTSSFENFGDVDICTNATLGEHTNPDSFRLCLQTEVQLNKVRHLHMIFNCMEFRGDIIFDSDGTGNGKNIASIMILNQIKLINVIRKFLTDNIIG